MEDYDEILRVEKLFPNDFLDLAAITPVPANQRATSKWQAAVIKTLKRVQAGPAAAGGASAAALSPTAAGGGAEKQTQQQSSYVTRKFLLESYAQLTVGLQTQERYLFLFNDVLFIAKPRPSAGGYKLKRRVQVSDMWITDVISDVSEATHCDPKRSFVIGWPVTNVVSTFESASVMQQWKAQLLTVMNTEKSKESLNITIDIYYRDVQSNASRTAAVNISRNMAASECVCKAMEMLGLEVCNAGNYQLWVTSSRENAAYPLFGHEEVFAIQMSHLRGNEQNHDVKCQFILKERKKPERLADRKPAKSRMMLDIGALFRKNTSKQQLASPTAGKDFTKGKLFGQPLSQVCTDGLPKSVQELLENLFNVAPVTCEIFRKPSTARECQEVVSKMNTDDQVCWPNYRKNGLLMASVLKSFLRELPNRLLHFELYSEWSDSTRIVDRHERIAKNQSLVLRLDECEREVLKRILCILHHVREHADTNRMTSYNLAVCLGPSLLWPPLGGKHDLSEASKLVPDVVQFMLDNCTEIFGQNELLMAFGHAPCPPPDDEEVSDPGEEEDDDEEEGEVAEEDDAMRSLRTQCSESLESISDNDAPCALQQMSPSSRSRDSGLILNDAPEECDQSDENVTGTGGTDDAPVGSSVDSRQAVASATATTNAVLANHALDKSQSYSSLAPGDKPLPLEAKNSVHGIVPSPIKVPVQQQQQQRARRPSGLGSRTRRIPRSGGSGGHHEESASACSSESAGAAGTDDTPPSPCGRAGGICSSSSQSLLCRSPAVLVKSSSGGHLCFDALATSEASIAARHASAAVGLKHPQLADLAEQSSKYYAESAPSLLNHRELSLSATLASTGAAEAALACKSLSSTSASSSSSPTLSDADDGDGKTDRGSVARASRAQGARMPGQSPPATSGQLSRSAQIRRRSLVEPHRHRGKCGPTFTPVSRPRRGLPERSVSVSEHCFGRVWSDRTADGELQQQQTALVQLQVAESGGSATGERSVSQAVNLSAASQVDRLVELVIELASGQRDSSDQWERLSSSSSGSRSATLADASGGHILAPGADLVDGGGNSKEACVRPVDLSEQQASRPRQPPPYNEAVQRHELNMAGVAEIERLKQTVMSARARQLYDRSLQMFEKEQQQQKPRHQTFNLRTSSSRSSLDESFGSEGKAVEAASETRPLASGTAARAKSTRGGSSTLVAAAADAVELRDRLQGRASICLGTSPGLPRRLTDATVVTTKDRTVIIRRSPVAKASAAMFYQPGNEAAKAGLEATAAVATRPANPPPYVEALSVQKRSGSRGSIGPESSSTSGHLPPESLV